MLKRLEDVALHGGSTELASKEQDFGFKYNPHGWFYDKDLDVNPMRLIAFDVMHGWCQHCVYEIELCSCMEVLSKRGHGSRQLHAYMQRFKWPRSYASGCDICNGRVQDRAQTKDVKPAGSAS